MIRVYSKKELLAQQLPTLPKRRTDAVYRANDIAYILKSRLAMNGKLLIVAFYDRESAGSGFSLPSVVLYLTKGEYVTLLNAPGGQKWKKCRTTHALGLGMFDKQQVISLKERDEKRIRDFLPVPITKIPSSTLIHRYIEAYQDVLLDKRLNEKKKRAAARVDDRMEATPGLPSAFARWLDRGPLLHSRYIYYRRVTKMKATGYCTHCKTDLTLTAPLPLHNGKGVCPSCRSKITFKATGRSKKVCDEGKAVILQKTRDGREYMLRYFAVSRSFVENYREPQDSIYERARLILAPDGGITGQYKYGWSAGTGRYGWHSAKDVITGKNKDITWEMRYGMYQTGWNVWFAPAHLYPCNLRSMLSGLNLSYDIIRNIKGRAVNVTTYLMRSMIYPFAPSLWRIGLSSLCTDLLEECLEPETYRPFGALHTRFGISKAFVSFMREHNLGMEAVALRAALGKEPDGEEFLWMLENKVEPGGLGAVEKYATFHKIKKYIERQIKTCDVSVWRESKAQNLMVLWKDYISMCEKLGYDLAKKSVLFPRNIKDEHDKVAQLIRITHDPVMDERIKTLYPELNAKYYYEDDEFLIRPPIDFNDFVREGVTLLHCVCANGYYKGHVAQTSYIFFIRRRKALKTPFYTVEFNPGAGTIRQCQGYRHAAATQKIKAFVDDWKQSLGIKEVAKAA